MGKSQLHNTLLGFAAIALWSSTIAITRSLSEQIGPLSSAAYTLLLGGMFGGTALLLSATQRKALARLPVRYLLGCGALFVGYMVCLYLAIGLAIHRQQVLEVGLLNYLWPSLTLLLAIPLLGKRPRGWLFALGVGMALLGATLAPLGEGTYSFATLVESLRSRPWPYALAILAAVLWALYSNLSRRWAGSVEGNAVPLFALVSGVVLFALRGLLIEPSRWSKLVVGEILFMAVFPTLLAYSFWDRALRKGNVTLVVALSYSIPVMSTLFSSLWLHTGAPRSLWAACGLIVVGAAVCERSLVGTKEQPAQGRT